MKNTINKITQTAKEVLLKNNYTCVLLSEKAEYHSTLRGVKPLVGFLESNEDFNGFCAADKTVGLGAAHLYILLGVKSVWANVMSRSARKLLEQNGICTFCENEVPYIINRRGDGACPVETAVKGITSSNQAFEVICEWLENNKKLVGP